MVNYPGPALDGVFGALADPTRRAILARLAAGEKTVTELAQPFPISLPAVSRHLRVLEEAGLLSRRREGRLHHCRLEARPLTDAAGWIEQQSQFWEERLDALKSYLEKPNRKPHGPRVKRRIR